MNVTELMVGQRWFGGAIEDLESSEIELERPLPTDPVVTQVLVRVKDERYQLLVDADGNDATLHAATSRGLLELVLPEHSAGSVRALGAEQSNTSLVYDERLLLKIFRRVGDEPNRDVDIAQALGRAETASIVPVLGRWQEDGRDYAVVQQFLNGATDGWSLALVSLRQLFDEGTAPETAGGDFAPEATRLGEMTGTLHKALADTFGTERASADTFASALADGLRADALRAVRDAGPVIAVHGDYHLGQVLRTDTQWYVVDFEGEPARTEGERNEWSSPLKDVAGMLRSFDYSSAVAARDDDHDTDTDGLARAWEQHNRHAFLDGYWSTVAGTGLVPDDPHCREVLLSAFELDKALYEVRYETVHRPTWADIPKAAVARLLAA